MRLETLAGVLLALSTSEAYSASPLNSLINEQAFVEASSTFRQRLLEINATDVASYQTVDQGLHELCFAVEDAVEVVGFSTVIELYASIGGIEKELNNKMRSDGLKLSGGGRHLLGTISMNHILNLTSLAWADRHLTRADIKTAANIISTAAVHSAGPVEPGILEYANGAPLHGAIWVLLSSASRGGSLEPADFWELTLSVCSALFGTGPFVDCLHGAGHGAMLNALLAVDRQGPNGTESCTFVLAKSLAISHEAVRQGVLTLQGAPARGLAHSASRGLWMTIHDTGNEDSELPPAAVLANVTVGLTLPLCSFEADLLPFCFTFITMMNMDEPYLWAGPPEQLVSDCIALPMLSERNIRGCIFGTLQAYSFSNATFFLGTEPFELGDQQASLDLCHGLDDFMLPAAEDMSENYRLRKLACIGGFAWGYGETRRITQRLSLAVSNTVAADTPSMCDLMAEEEKAEGRWSGAGLELALDLCTANWNLCQDGSCNEMSDYFALSAEILDR